MLVRSSKEVMDELFKFAERDGKVSSQLMFEEVEEVVEGGGKDYGAVPVEKVKNWAREVKVRGLYHLSTPELEDRVNGKDNLEEGKGFGGWVILKDVFASDSKEGDEFGGVGK